ncbi:MAG: hypothetical protein COA59_15555 [Colwellia sp.]|nr:MAG: hypothetical protein COA59_15555 [Colwellia sp.]
MAENTNSQIEKIAIHLTPHEINVLNRTIFLRIVKVNMISSPSFELETELEDLKELIEIIKV